MLRVKTTSWAETPTLVGVAQATPQFDPEIAEKGHLWMETNEYIQIGRWIWAIRSLPMSGKS